MAGLAMAAATLCYPPALGGIRRVAVTPPPAAEPGPYAPGSAAPLLECIAWWESRGRYDAVSRSGRHRGRYQFAASTWRGAVSRAGHPEWATTPADQAPPAVQDAAAGQLLAERGLSPWPTPSRRCGHLAYRDCDGGCTCADTDVDLGVGPSVLATVVAAAHAVVGRLPEARWQTRGHLFDIDLVSGPSGWNGRITRSISFVDPFAEQLSVWAPATIDPGRGGEVAPPRASTGGAS